MRPDPPDLGSQRAVSRRDFLGHQEWHRHNRNASFALIKVDDPEIWAITAFVKKISSVSPDDYKTWTKTSASAN
jgi:hypothetical protein